MMAMNTETLSLIKQSIKTIPNYPKEGILFRDVTSLLENSAAYKATIDLLVEHYRGQGFTKIVGTEARGFLFGAPLALELGVGFVPVRKPGKLPRATISQSYELEYGHDSLEIHTDAINPNDKVLVVDDLLATGGTIEATVKLIRQLGGEVKHAAFVISLPDLGGEARLTALGLELVKLCEFEGE
ncbi:adenine phosphoribosyltransferase [Shewanella baltica]|nr:adenine phosphoribosyltransferase [Shewanella baltica]